MSEEYVNWDIHATTDVLTPRIEHDDPLSSQFNEFENGYTADDSNLSHFDNIINSSEPTISSSPTSSSSSQKSDTDIKAIPMKITISDPIKQLDNAQNAFMSYLLTINTKIEGFNATRPVRRRYQDFVWLHTVLELEYPACIVPPLPEKHRLEYLKGDRFSPEFIQRRLLSLQWFLDRLSRHSLLQKSSCTRIFLTSTDFNHDKQAQVLAMPHTASLLESIGDTLVNAFAKIKKPDEKFEDLKEHINKFEESLNTIERLYMRINKRQKDLQSDHTQFANCIQGLSALETTITKPLHQFAETLKSYSKVIEEMNEKEEVLFLNEIHGLLAYCHSAKDLLKARDQKQLDFEGLSVFLQQTINLRDRTQYPGQRHNERGISAGGLYIAEYVTDKLNEVRGVNIAKERQDKLNRLEKRVNELREEVTRTNDDLIAFSNQVVKEFEVFEKSKVLELKQGLLAYADCHVEFYQKGIVIWEKILPTLENIDVIPDNGL